MRYNILTDPVWDVCTQNIDEEALWGNQGCQIGLLKLISDNNLSLLVAGCN